MAPRGLLVLVVVVMLGSMVCGGSALRRSVKQLAWEAKEILQKCSGRNDSHWDCVWDQGLAAVNDFVSREKIPLVTGVSLVRVKAANSNSSSNPTPSETSKTLGNATEEQEQMMGKTWTSQVLDALDHMFETHVLQIDLFPRNSNNNARGNSNHNTKRKNSTTEDGWWQKNSFRGFEAVDVGEGRHRRRQQMIPMMIFGVVVFGSFVIPMGFQFLAALSGKAFLMAKLALLLASINGLKRVAQPGVHYGLYHHVDSHHLHGNPGVLYDRDNGGFGPRSLPPIPPPPAPHPTE